MMGREARRNAAARAAGGDGGPPSLTYGDAARIVAAHAALLEVLGSDPRIVEHYKRWFNGRDLPRLWRSIAYVPTAEVRPLMSALTAPTTPAELADMVALLDGMGMAPELVEWVAPGLLFQHAIAAYSDINPTDRQVITVTADGLGSLPHGRRPKHQGAGVRSDVGYFYRARLKSPAESVYALGLEYAKKENRHTRADSVVQDAIERAENLLTRAVTPKGGQPVH